MCEARKQDKERFATAAFRRGVCNTGSVFSHSSGNTPDDPEKKAACCGVGYLLSMAMLSSQALVGAVPEQPPSDFW